MLKIATFNCKNLSINNDDKINNLAATIMAANPDICAIQEINNLEALPLLLSYLPNVLEIHHEISISTSKIPEFIAFLYNPQILKPIGCTTFTQQEKSLYVGKGKLLMRAPAYARFASSEYDITLISVHINESNPMHDCHQMKKIIRAIQQTNTCNNIIILGDFNANCQDRHVFKKFYQKDYMPTLPYDVNTNKINTSQYDNIWIHQARAKIVKPATVFRDDIPEDVLVYSDHCLVQAEIHVKTKFSPNHMYLHPPNMTQALQKKSMFNIMKIPCCNKTRIACECQYED